MKVIERTNAPPNVKYPEYYDWYLCRCDCGKEKVVRHDALLNGSTKSCGHFRIGKKQNEFINCGAYTEVLDSKQNKFIVDSDDVALISVRYWYVGHDGYVMSVNKNDRTILLHRFLLNPTDEQYVDHIDRNPSNNTRNNLRLCSRSENAMNKDPQSNNKSGIIGVWFSGTSNKWVASIKRNQKTIHLGEYECKTDAIIARLHGEREYFKEFAPQKHLYKQYGIEVEQLIN